MSKLRKKFRSYIAKSLNRCKYLNGFLLWLSFILLFMYCVGGRKLPRLTGVVTGNIISKTYSISLTYKKFMSHWF